jgi:alpha-D-ribose 1-methylphosphonate 5-triphosphate diphosphatase
VTTAWLAQSWSWEGGFRSGQATTALLAALGAVRAALLPDMRVQIRLETHLIEAHAEVLAAVSQHSVDYVVFNNHLPEALEMAAQKPDRFAQWALSTQRSTDQMLAIVRAADAQGADVPAALARLAAQFAALGVAMGSHDDGSADVRRAYRDMGAHICEFPTTFEAAQSAKDAGEPVLMGAPNVVRGGSQSGNISAQALIAAGLCDALVSDYYYPALALAAFHLAAEKVMDLPAAWAMISTNPARIAGLADRGTLHLGARADVVAVNPETHGVEMTICAGRIAHLSGEVARRVWAAAPKGLALG